MLESKMAFHLFLLALPLCSWGEEVRYVGSRVRLVTTPPPTTTTSGQSTLRARVLEEGDDWITYVPSDGQAVTLAKDGKRMVGKLVGMDERELHLRVSGSRQELRIPRESVVRFEVSQGRLRAKGLLLGTAAGAAPGAAVLLWMVVSGNGKDGYMFTGRTRAATAAMMGGGLVGLIGLVSGGPEDWQEVSKSRFKVTVAPSPGGASAQVVIRF